MAGSSTTWETPTGASSMATPTAGRPNTSSALIGGPSSRFVNGAMSDTSPKMGSVSGRVAH